ncbi:MAG: helix-turn-helix transcriptional regulator [Bacteroidota bacterium]
MPSIELPIPDLIFALFAWSVLICSALLAGFLFFKRAGRQLTNRLLASVLWIGALILLQNLIVLLALAHQFKTLYVLPLDFTLSIPPLVYFYFKFKLHPSQRFRGRDSVHAILPGVQAVLTIFLGFSSLSVKRWAWESGFLTIYEWVDNLLFPILIIGYGYAAFQLLKERKQAQRQWNELLEQWLIRFLKVLIILVIVRVVFMIAHELYFSASGSLYGVHFCILLSLLLYLGLKTWQQYFPQHIYQLAPSEIPKPSIPSAQTHFQKRTQQLFEEEQIFLNPDLNLAMLSRAYGLSKRQLSLQVQQQLGKNVNELINHYRVQYVLHCLKEGQHLQYNILSIGYSAGFSSKSTFYRAFKQMTGSTPSEYTKNG